MNNKGEFKVVIVDFNDSKAVEELESLLNDGWRLAGPNAAISSGSGVLATLWKADEVELSEEQEQENKVDMFNEGVREGELKFKRKAWYIRLFPSLEEDAKKPNKERTTE